jgi:hypothetical protein
MRLFNKNTQYIYRILTFTHYNVPILSSFDRIYELIIFCKIQGNHDLQDRKQTIGNHKSK